MGIIGQYDPTSAEYSPPSAQGPAGGPGSWPGGRYSPGAVKSWNGWAYHNYEIWDRNPKPGAPYGTIYVLDIGDIPAQPVATVAGVWQVRWLDAATGKPDSTLVVGAKPIVSQPWDWYLTNFWQGGAYPKPPPPPKLPTSAATPPNWATEEADWPDDPWAVDYWRQKVNDRLKGLTVGGPGRAGTGIGSSPFDGLNDLTGGTLSGGPSKGGTNSVGPSGGPFTTGTGSTGSKPGVGVGVDNLGGPSPIGGGGGGSGGGSTPSGSNLGWTDDDTWALTHPLPSGDVTNQYDQDSVRTMMNSTQAADDAALRAALKGTPNPNEESFDRTGVGIIDARQWERANDWFNERGGFRTPATDENDDPNSMGHGVGSGGTINFVDPLGDPTKELNTGDSAVTGIGALESMRQSFRNRHAYRFESEETIASPGVGTFTGGGPGGGIVNPVDPVSTPVAGPQPAAYDVREQGMLAARSNLATEGVNTVNVNQQVRAQLRRR